MEPIQMSRRRKRIPEELFITPELTKLEDRMIGLIRKPDLTVTKVMEWLFPDAVLKILRDAHPYVMYSKYAMFDTSYFKVAPDTAPVHLSVLLRTTGLTCPCDKSEMIQAQRDSGIVAYIQEVYAVRLQWNKVREVVSWMNDPSHKMTPAAARAFWPSILSLVGPDHPVHQVDGQRYRDPQGIGAIIPLMRETSEIVATALLMPDPELKLGPVRFDFEHLPREHGLV